MNQTDSESDSSLCRHQLPPPSTQQSVCWLASRYAAGAPQCWNAKCSERETTRTHVRRTHWNRPRHKGLSVSHRRPSCDVQMNFSPSYMVARQLRMSPRCLSLLTSSLHVRVDDKRVDLGLCVKNAPKGLCVPDYAKPQPDRQGWLYSPSLVQTLEAYKVCLTAYYARMPTRTVGPLTPHSCWRARCPFFDWQSVTCAHDSAAILSQAQLAE